ncbi:helix-turn-helix domain-containing protein [Granulicella sp. 5B5]|uniref:helix-turn-helix domain-containing protein n=1 Tax=Granulicella sp. 5B5 TaxID=1617967 RepID=UPI0015F370FC|nr:helix-turn-helix domain-containing protein [Granulicella sp. 5B5]
MASTQLRSQIRRVAPYFRSLSLTGEPGCGEEAVARLLHQMCPVHELGFAMVHATEAEEWFGGEGVVDWRGVGLLYLPEAERLSRAAQEGLLRMMRQHGTQTTRVVAFVGRGLKPYISAGFFLPELAGYLASLRVALPTLRDRAADLPALIHDRLQRRRMEQAAVGLRTRPVYATDSFLDAAAEQEWPGNLYQLNDVVDWLVEHRAGVPLDAEDLGAALKSSEQKPRPVAARARLVKLDQIVQEHIRNVLLACNGNKLKAAEVLGISRSTLYRMLDAAEAGPLLLAG